MEAIRAPVHIRYCVSWRRHAFSITELLAIITMAVLLLAMVMPSLEHARQRSAHAVCTDRLGALAQASRVYQTSDADGLIIPVHPGFFELYDDSWGVDKWTGRGAYEWGGKSGVGQVGDPSSSFPGYGSYAFLSSKYGTNVGSGPVTRPLNEILYPSGFKNAFGYNNSFDRYKAEKDTLLSLDAYRCPSDDGPPLGAHCQDWIEHPGRSAYDHFGNSFSANVLMISGSWGGAMRSASPYLRPASRVPNAARTLLYEENIGRWAWACKRELSACINVVGHEGIDPGPTRAVRGWHGKNWTFNRAFVDAHVEYQPVYIEGTENQDGYANHYRSEVVFENEAQQNYYGCVIIRGPGWQKDTFPAPDIPTGLYYGWNYRASYEYCVSPED